MANNIRIAIVTNALHLGGASNSLLRLGRFLSQEGYDIEFVTTAYPGPWFDRARELGLRVRHIRGHNESYHVLHALRVGWALVKGRFDIVFLSTEIYAQSALNMLPSNVIVIPMIRCNDDIACREGCINNKTWNVALCVSPGVASKVKSILPDRPVVHISNGVDIPEKEVFERRTAFCNPLRLLFLGRLEQREKNILILPEIVKESRDRNLKIFLTIIGDGPDREAAEKKAKDLNVTSSIYFRGALSHSAVYEELLHSHVLLMPSFFEGLPGAPLEAQACGCVPITSHLVGITDVVVENDTTGFLVDANNVEGFVDAIELLYNNPGKWLEISHAGRQKIMREFTIDAMGAKYVTLIEDALGGRYPLPRPRSRWRPVHLRSYTWRQLIPKSIRYWRHPIHNFLNRRRRSSQPSLPRSSVDHESMRRQ